MKDFECYPAVLRSYQVSPHGNEGRTLVASRACIATSAVKVPFHTVAPPLSLCWGVGRWYS